MEKNKYEDVIENQIKESSKIIALCVDQNHEGKGICKVDGIKDSEMVKEFIIFVDNMIPGEKGQIEITKLHNSYGYAKIIKIFHETKSPKRVIPHCKTYGSCGGCNIMHMSYNAQLEFKNKMVEETLRRIGGFNDIKILPILGMKDPNHYRNKVQIPYRKGRFKVDCGFFARESHRIIPMDECFIQPNISTEIIKFIKNLCNEFNIEGYHEKYNSGLIRHVLIRTNHLLDEVMVVLVLTKRSLEHKDEIVAKIIQRYPVVKSIIINVNNKIGNTILGDECITIYGREYIVDECCGLKFRIGPQSFYQVNHKQTEVLYNKVVEIGDFKQEDFVIDAYCGIGTIGLIVASHVKQVLSVEIVEEAICNAKQNAKNNQINNIHFVCNKAEEQIVKWAKENKKIDAIIVDPPRKGCDSKLLDTIDEMKINKMIYVSCDPATLARDLKIMVEKGYDIKLVQPVDMFPHTSNCETIVLLSQRKPNDYVEVEVDTNEFPISSAELKAAYQDLIEYILKKHNVKVTNLEIAQMKQKYGIKERECYNKGKDNSKYLQPKCTKQKEELIIEAFKHFKMI